MRKFVLSTTVGSKAMMAAAVAAVVFFGVVPSSQASTITSAMATPPGGTGFPVAVTLSAGNLPGTLLASVTDPYTYTTTAGTSSGTVYSSVYKESTGTLDFYYQIVNSPTSSTPVARTTETSFTGYTTILGYLTDGSFLGGSFTNGTVSPLTVDSNSTGSTIGFSFNPPVTSEVSAGATSTVLFIATNATNYIAGNTNIIDGGTTTVSTFMPASGVPEPASLVLMGMGLVGLAGIRRFRR